jgi:very-short-patch-repair endonuclease/predicted transcriptional regulator of viral defense system
MEHGVRPDVQLAHLAAEHWGVLSLAELRGCGFSRKAIAARVARGQLHPMHRGVYAVGHARPPLEGRWLGAVKACGGDAALSHFSAAALWEIVDWEERYPEVTVPATSAQRHRGLRVHRSSMLAASDVARHRGIPVTSPARTLLDLAATLHGRPLRRAVRQAQSLQRVNVRQLAELLARAGPRRGTRRLATIIATGPAPTRSELEDVVIDLLHTAGLQRPRINEAIALDGRRLIPDFRWPDQRLILEADGAAWHDNPTARADDHRRQALLEAHGERVLRITWQEAVARPGETLERIRAAGAPPQAPRAAVAPVSAPPASRARESAWCAAGEST